MSREADPLADRTVAAIMGPWSDAEDAMGAGMARLGRATRLCDFGGTDVKDAFRVFDAVRIFEAIGDMTAMQPVVVNETGALQPSRLLSG